MSDLHPVGPRARNVPKILGSVRLGPELLGPGLEIFGPARPELGRPDPGQDTGLTPFFFDEMVRNCLGPPLALFLLARSLPS